MKHALITGASRGLGSVLAGEFFHSGWSVALVARDEHALESLARELRDSIPAAPGEVRVLAADLSEPTTPERLFWDVRRFWPRLDAIVNNAGAQGPIGKAWACDPTEWEDVFRILLFAPAALCRLTVPWMMETGGGAIVNLSGGGAAGPRPNFSAYAAAKTALVRFTETLAAECAGLGITVNAVAPGAMPSAMLGTIVDAGPGVAGEKEFLAAQNALDNADSMAFRRAARCVRFLCEPEGKAITGKLVSAAWDNYEDWPAHAGELADSDLYTLRRITGRDRGMDWGDK